MQEEKKNEILQNFSMPEREKSHMGSCREQHFHFWENNTFENTLYLKSILQLIPDIIQCILKREILPQK